MKNFNWKARLTNVPYFWVPVVAAFLSSLHIEASDVTSWPILLDYVKDWLTNPFVLGTTIIAWIGIANDPSTKGLGDTQKKEAESHE